MRNLLLILSSLLLFFSSCSKDQAKQAISTQISTQMTQVLSTNLECSNISLMTSDIKVMVDKAFKIEKLQAKMEQLKDADIQLDGKVIICQSLTTAMMPTLMSLIKTGKLKEWNCKFSKGEDYLKNLLHNACRKLAK